MRSIVDDPVDGSQAVKAAIAAATSFPLLMGTATLIGAIFLLLSPLFLIALAV